MFSNPHSVISDCSKSGGKVELMLTRCRGIKFVTNTGLGETMQQRNNRVIPVIAAIAIQLCLGTAYVWSLFQNGIAKSIFNGDHAAAGLTFSLLLATLSIGSTIGGKLTGRFGPRKVVMAGGLILALGFFAASFTTAASPWMIWVTYGVLGGVGMGFTYSTTIACAQKWFPDKRGFITGLIVASLGFGGVLFTPLIETLIHRFGGTGMGELQTFMVLSAIFAVVCTIGGWFVQDPPNGYLPAGYTPPTAGSKNAVRDFAPGEVLRLPQFYLLTITLMLACMGGLMMIGFAKPIAIAKGMSSTATIGVLMISLFNSFGRLFWGWASDKLGRRNTVIILLAGNAALSLLVNLATGYMIYVLIALIGLFYGGFLSTFPAFTADLFGSKHMATNYGMVLIGFGVGAVVSSYIAGYYKNIAVNDISLMTPAFVIAAIAAVAGIAIILMLKKPQAIAHETDFNKEPAQKATAVNANID
jgi:OFA family oxalate/formate antiporter-like MFS transporter